QGLNDPERYGWMRFELNQVLMLVGIEIRDDGQFYSVSKAQSLGEVQRRTKALREKLTGYGVHSAVLRCCRDELLAQDYFHAVQEAAKSLCDRVRTMSGLTTDGVRLFNTAFAVGDPYVAYNSLRTSSEQNQQNGLKEMLCGVIHMVRNVTAHELRIHWDVNEKDAVDILTQISYLHKLLDVCVTVPRTTLRK
ncbi:MAG TPA: TIGR02391 family protein, partial [Candidatus Pullichristensenella stercorigallinarum]|nr:TIGR02391 family protein [Candidatus Pullichristensenella stercorigallinarum]